MSAETPPSTDWPLWTAGFRPFFLAAGCWAVLAMLAWILMLRGLLDLPTRFDPVQWHHHELLFGFVPAAIAGFLLTAVPNWTGRPPIRGRLLVVLALLWLLGRIGVACSGLIGALPAALADLSFLVLLLVLVAREIILAGNRRNLPVPLVLAVLTLANLMVHLGSVDFPLMAAAGERLAIGIVILLISLIGGRIVPAFTGNWLRGRGEERLPAAFGRLDSVAVVLSIIALVAWVVIGLQPLTGAALILAGIGQALRLGRWRGFATRSEPLLWILHVGYAWIPLGLVLLGAAAWRPQLTTPGIHALTAGAMGTMILAVMTRATLGHSQRPLTAGTGTLIAYMLVLIAGAARLAGPFTGTGYGPALDLAASAWMAGFALFVVLYAPLYLRPSPERSTT